MTTSPFIFGLIRSALASAALLVAQSAFAGPFSMPQALPISSGLPSWNPGDETINAVTEFSSESGGFIAASHAGDRVFVVSNLSDVPVTKDVSRVMKGPEALCAIHADSDEFPDLVVSSRWDRKLILLTNDGAGGFDEGTTIASNVDTATSLIAADLDGDGLEDLVGVADHQREVFWLKRLGTGGFSDRRTLAKLSHPATQVEAATLVPGPSPDLVVLAGGSIQILHNQDDGSFKKGASLGAGISSLAIVNLTGNSSDIIAMSSTSGACLVWKNQGNGTFSPAQVLVANLPNHELTSVADLNGDGVPDLCFVSLLNGGISWMRGNGNDSFQAPVKTRLFVAQPAAVMIAATKTDAVADLVFAGFQGSALRYARGFAADPYSFWVDDQGLDPATNPPNGDANQDGVVNLLAFGSNLTLTETSHNLAAGTGTSGLPTASIGSNGEFAFEFLRRRTDSLKYAIWESDDLKEWALAELSTAQVAPIIADWERVRYVPRLPLNGKIFVRLELTLIDL